MGRRDWLRWVVAACVGLASCLALGAQPGDEATLVVLHLNDSHGALRPQMAQVATLIAAERRARPGHVLALHAGDLTSRGGPLTVWSGGAWDLATLGQAGFDVMTAGNGDFYFGWEHLRELARRSPLPILQGNVAPADGSAWLPGSLVKDIGGIKVGLLGLGEVHRDHPSWLGLTWRDPVAVAREQVPRLREQADVVVVLSHLGVDDDRALAAAVPGIDLIVGGHSHTELPQPLRVAGPGGGQTVIVQAGDLARFLGRVELRLARAAGHWRLQASSARLQPVSPAVVPDPGVAAWLDARWAEVQQPAFEVERDWPNPPTGPSPAGQLLCEAVAAAAGVPLVLLERGAVQAGLSRGPRTPADLCQVHPWRNRIRLVELTGDQLRTVLATTDVHSSGCSYSKSGADVTSLCIAGRPVVGTQRYRLAVGSFLWGSTPLLREAGGTWAAARVDTALVAWFQARGHLPQRGLEHFSQLGRVS